MRNEFQRRALTLIHYHKQKLKNFAILTNENYAKPSKLTFVTNKTDVYYIDNTRNIGLK